MIQIGWGYALAFLLLATPASPGIAQETTELPMCDPITLEYLFPEPAEPPIDETAADESPTEKVPAVEGPAAAEEAAEPDCTPFVYEMTFPIAGVSVAVYSFGADRSDHHHAGNDIAAASLTPVVATTDGRVSWIADECCALAIRHNDGWTTWYIHLNNDTFGTDNGLGWGIAPDLDVGSGVEEGEIIGWVGDSGNAEDSQPHLHFELRDPSGVAVDPAASLLAAQVQYESQRFNGPFADDDGSPHAWAISTLTSIGLLTACDEDPAAFCPDRPTIGIDVAALVQRITDVDITDIRQARSPEGPVSDELVRRIGVVRSLRSLSSCPLNEFCIAEPITFAELEMMLAVLPALAVRETDTLMTVDDFAAAMLAQLESDAPLAYCSKRGSGYVTNGELAEMVARALGMVGAPPCDQID